MTSKLKILLKSKLPLVVKADGLAAGKVLQFVKQKTGLEYFKRNF